MKFLVKRGREYHSCGEEYNVKKGEICGRKSVKKNGTGEEYQITGNFINPGLKLHKIAEKNVGTLNRSISLFLSDAMSRSHELRSSVSAHNQTK